jgi:hypothetical protein
MMNEEEIEKSPEVVCDLMKYGSTMKIECNAWNSGSMSARDEFFM